MLIKIDSRKIDHQSNVETFSWNNDNLIKSKLKQIRKSNSQLTQAN